MRFRERYSLSCAGWKANNDEEEPERAGISNSALERRGRMFWEGWGDERY
jgi:hypothetical protein